MSVYIRIVVLMIALSLIGSTECVAQSGVSPFVGTWKVTNSSYKGKTITITHLSGDNFQVKTDKSSFTAVSNGKMLGYYSDKQRGLWTYKLIDRNHLELIVTIEHAGQAGTPQSAMRFERAASRNTGNKTHK